MQRIEKNRVLALQASLWAERRIGDRTQFHVLHQIAFKELLTLGHQPFYDSLSGPKVQLYFEIAKCYSQFLTI